MTNETIEALSIIQKSLLKKGFGLKLYDGYRPQKSVNDFIEWSKKINDTLTKQKYYPNEKKIAFSLKVILLKNPVTVEAVLLMLL